MFEGVIIHESLEDSNVLNRIEIVSTHIEVVTSVHRTPWLRRWTLHTVLVGDKQAAEVAEMISRALDSQHSGSWYADFKSDTHHYVIFREKVFFIDRRRLDEYEAARRYGIERGLPEHQADFVFLIET